MILVDSGQAGPRWLLLGFFLAAVGCAGDDEPEPEAITYQRHIRPLIEANCLSCHVEGGVGPFRLDDWSSVHAEKQRVVAAVASRYMPPWPASDDCHDLADVRSLPDEQRELFSEWARGGYPEGSPEEYEAPAEKAAWIPDLGPPNLIFESAEGYVPDPSVHDEYRCFLTPGIFEADTFVTAMDIRPGVLSQVHHVQVHKISAALIPDVQALDDAAFGSGYPCAGAGVGSVNMFSWRPGSTTVRFADGDAALIEAGSAIVLQVHYNNQMLPPGATLEPDVSGVAFWSLPPGELPERIILRTGHFGLLGPWEENYPTGVIRAGQEHTVGETPMPMTLMSRVRGTYVSGEIIGMTPHMHMFGTRLTETLKRSDGTEQCLIDVPNWNFEWQLDYSLATPITYSAEDVLTVRCQYDNSADNQPMLHGERLESRDIIWGEGSLDEMCLNYVWFRYARDDYTKAGL